MQIRQIQRWPIGQKNFGIPKITEYLDWPWAAYHDAHQLVGNGHMTLALCCNNNSQETLLRRWYQNI